MVICCKEVKKTSKNFNFVLIPARLCRFGKFFLIPGKVYICLGANKATAVDKSVFKDLRTYRGIRIVVVFGGNIFFSIYLLKILDL